MKIAVVGSRNLTLNIDRYIPQNTNLIVSGGAIGIDSVAENYANLNNLNKCIIKPNYKMYGKQATLIRNDEIVKKVNLVLAFWDGNSRGTQHVLKCAAKRGKEVKLHIIEKLNAS